MRLCGIYSGKLGMQYSSTISCHLRAASVAPQRNGDALKLLAISDELVDVGGRKFAHTEEEEREHRDS